MYKQIIEKRKGDFEKAIEHLQQELSGVRTGRANTALVENIPIESYGTTTLLKNLASISIPESRTISIQPWDRNLLSAIEKAVQNSNLGAQPVNDGNFIRINLPQLSEERRKELIKIIKQNAENTRVRIRNIREDIWKEVGNLVKEKKLTEDQKYEAQDELKKKVDELNEVIKTMVEKKETEILVI